MNNINSFISNLTKAQKIVLAIIVPLALLVIVWTICNNMDWISYGTYSGGSHKFGIPQWGDIMQSRVYSPQVKIHIEKVWGLWFAYFLIVGVFEFILFGKK